MPAPPKAKAAAPTTVDEDNEADNGVEDEGGDEEGERKEA